MVSKSLKIPKGPIIFIMNFGEKVCCFVCLLWFVLWCHWRHELKFQLSSYTVILDWIYNLLIVFFDRKVADLFIKTIPSWNLFLLLLEAPWTPSFPSHNSMTRWAISQLINIFIFLTKRDLTHNLGTVFLFLPFLLFDDLINFLSLYLSTYTITTG